MESKNRIIRPEELHENVFTAIGRDWMLITAGPPERYNTMTASWGGMGVIWNRNACFVFVRNSRYTYEFMEKNETFSLCFFDKKWRKALDICGSKSGRDVDKASLAGITPAQGSFGTTYFKEARLVLTCKKVYFHDLDPRHFLDENIIKNYPAGDFHRMYIGAILEASVRED